MRPSNPPVLLLTLATLLCAGAATAQDTQSKPLPPRLQEQSERRAERAAERERLAALDEAWKAGDFAQVETLLNHAWTTDRGWALRSSFSLITSPDISVRPLGIAQLAAHATPEELANALDTLDPARLRPERRALAMLATPSLAKAPEEQFQPLIAALLRDQDRILRAAAATAIAKRGDASHLRALLPLLRESPTQKPSWDGDEEDILQSRLYGAFEAISGIRPRNATEAGSVPLVPSPASETAPQEASDVSVQKIRGRTYYALRRFELCFEFGKGREGDVAMARAVDAFASPASDRIASVGQPIFGPLTIASPRLIIADRSRYSAVGGNSFRPGSGTGNEIALLESLPDAMAATVAHECVHVYHGASFEKQPRWLSEGLAESLSISSERSIWNEGEVRRRNLDDDLDKGLFSTLIGWKGPASSGDRENRLYAMGHLAVDYLRFGPHAAPETRLHLLMARLAVSESDRSALEKLYGASLRDLDRKAASWARGMP